jgi:hypothetical protein
VVLSSTDKEPAAATWFSVERWKERGDLPIFGVADMPFYARVGAFVAMGFLAVSLAVGMKLSSDAFSSDAAWSEAIADGASVSFANFELDASVEGDGRVVSSAQGPLFANGQELLLTAVPSDGAVFTGWVGDVESTDNPLLVTMDDDVSVEARFETDETPPVVEGVAVSPASASAIVRWTTDDLSTSSVQVGTTTGYEMGAIERPELTRDHSVVVTGLTPGVEYHVAVSSKNGSGASGSGPDTAFVAAAGSVPGINVWYGERQVVGAHGQPQTAYNLLGNVADPDGVSSLSYSLNGGPSRGLTLGADTRRNQAPGDFNADIPYAELQPGENQVVLTATDGGGSTASITVVLDYQPTPAQLPFETDWRSAGRIGDQAQVVDGHWSIDGDTVRPAEYGYDRIVAFGDVSWHDYEMTVTLTPEALGPLNGSENSGNSLVGIALNWNGHTQRTDEQPASYWYPAGSLAWYRWYEPRALFELRGNLDQPIVRHNRFELDFGRTYVFKARSETVEGGIRYSWKVWEQGTPEPAPWDLEIVEDAGPATGSVGIIAHHIDVQWGDVSVTSID